MEEIGQRFEMDEARERFVKSEGDIWRGELIETEGEPGWEAATLKEVPSTGKPPRGG